MSATEDRPQGIYELGYLILPSTPEDALKEVVLKLKNIFLEAGGSEVGSEDPFKMDLAYQMSKTVGARKYVVGEAYIGWMKFEVSPEAVPAISEEVKKIDEVLRFLLIKAPKESRFTFESAKRALEEAEAAKKQAALPPVVEEAKVLETPPEVVE